MPVASLYLYHATDSYVVYPGSPLRYGVPAYFDPVELENMAVLR